jgi:hypothetical protein
LESLKGRDHSENLGINGRIILKSILGNRIGDVDWIHADHDRGRWRTR